MTAPGAASRRRLRRRPVGGALLLLLLLLTGLAAPASAWQVVHQERSLYRNVIVRDDAGQRCLLFSVKRAQRHQSCIELDDPQRVVFPYVQMTFAALLVQPAPRRILIAGLGGGTLTTILARLYPEAHIDSIEIDPAVVGVAERWFGFEGSARTPVHIQDARVFIRRAIAARTTPWDLVVLDAFNGDYIPEHLMTREFLADVHQVTSATGVVVANTFAISALYDHESTTWESVFGPFFNLKLPTTANRVIIAARAPLPPRELLRQRANELAPRLSPHGVDLPDLARRLRTDRDWDPRARVLTDQFAPANLLRER